MKDNITSIGTKLYILREQNSMTQDHLAEVLGVTRQTISNWENDKVKIDIGKATQICQLFSISLDEFVSKNIASNESICSEAAGTISDTRSVRVRVILLTCLLISLFIAFVTCIVLYFSCADNAEVSSTIMLTESAVYAIMAILFLASIIVITCLWVSRRKRKKGMPCNRIHNA